MGFYYNNIRPPLSLDGMTPAQVAGLPSAHKEDNPWLTYIKEALKEENHILLIYLINHSKKFK